MTKILVPIDGSTSSFNAAEQATALARMFGCEVTFLSVVEVSNAMSYTDVGGVYNANYFELVDNMIKIDTERMDCMLDSLFKTLNCSGFRANKKIVVGIAHPKIVEIAEEGQYDLIVMGHRGLNTFKRLFLGSVAKRVIEDAPCSVLIVK